MKLATLVVLISSVLELVKELGFALVVLSSGLFVLIVRCFGDVHVSSRFLGAIMRLSASLWYLWCGSRRAWIEVIKLMFRSVLYVRIASLVRASIGSISVRGILKGEL